VSAVVAVLAQPLPKIAYLSILPELVVLGGAVAIMGASSLIRRPLSATTTTSMTVATALASLSVSLVQWFDVVHHGPHVAIASAVVEDGFSSLVAVLVSCAVFLAALVGDGWIRREAARGPELHILAPVGFRGDDHGRRQRPHRGVPGPRDHVDLAVRAGGDECPARRVG
jgi:NADH:ubiquinone oxidoreductase subunit 2 (subunit N)